MFLVVGTILIIVMLASIVPLFQVIRLKIKGSESQTVFYFDEELLNYDTDELKFENVKAFQNRNNNRTLIGSRGSVRQAIGNVYDAQTFEEAKAIVYSIELP